MIMDQIRLNGLRPVIERLDYPIVKDTASEELDDVTLLYADGEEPLAAVVSRSNLDSFEDVEALELEIQNNLPIEAVGEPGQSDGDA
jgi:hypothetical protein